MKTLNKIMNLALLAVLVVLGSCDDDITERNINPNGVNLEEGNPSFLLTDVMVNTAMDVGNKGYSNPLAATFNIFRKIRGAPMITIGKATDGKLIITI